MDALYQWIGSLLCFLIFITMATELLPSKKYEKYIRFFAGIVFILLMLQPLTGSLRLEDRLAYYFEAISFQKESRDLSKEILGIETERLRRVIAEYEQAVEWDIKAMAEDMDFVVEAVEVTIESDQEKASYGTVTHVAMVVAREGEDGAAEAEEGSGEGRNKIIINAIEIEPVEAGGKENGELGESVQNFGQNHRGAREEEGEGYGVGERGEGTKGVGKQGEGTRGVEKQGEGTEGMGEQGERTEGMGRRGEGTERTGRRGEGTGGVGKQGERTEGVGEEGEGTERTGRREEGTGGVGKQGERTEGVGRQGENAEDAGSAGEGTQGMGRRGTESGKAAWNQDLEQLRKKVERYYGLEGREVEIELKVR